MAWLGTIPESWGVERSKWLLTRLRRQPRHSDGVVTVFRDGQVTLRSNRRLAGFTEAIQEIGYQGIRAGDLVVHGMDGFAGAIGVSDADGKATPVVHVYRSSHMSLPFVAHVLRTAASTGFIQSLAKGIRERSTAFDSATLANLLIAFPPLAEQQQIVEYLDRELARIDELIREQESLIASLSLRRQAVITGAFEGNLTETLPLRRDIGFLTSGSRGWAQYDADEGSRFIRIADLPRAGTRLKCTDPKFVDVPEGVEGSRTRLISGDLVFSITAYLGSVAVVTEVEAGSYVSQHVALCRLSGRRWDANYVAWFCLSDAGQHQLKEQAYGGTKQQLALDDIRELRLPVPDLPTQLGVVAELESRTQQIDELVGECRDLITLLKERRSALITAAVTGKIDVRGQ